MIWLLCWAEILDRYSRAVKNRKYPTARKAENIPTTAPAGRHLRLVSVNGVLISKVTYPAR
jgi:hypothetical protein